VKLVVNLPIRAKTITKADMASKEKPKNHEFGKPNGSRLERK
jgi:hypothetical protein